MIRHAVETISKVKKARSKPAKIAPITLVAANSMPRRIIETRVVPSIPKSRVLIVEQKQDSHLVGLWGEEVASRIARYTTAIPKRTHKKAGVIVIVAIKVSIPVITPIMIAATIAILVHCALHLQESSDI